MTTIIRGVHATRATDAGAPAPSGDAAEPAGVTGSRSGSSPLSTGLVLGGAVAALAGYALYHRPISSKVIGAVEGVELLSNPRLPKGFSKGTWSTPQTGSVFGVAPAARVSIEHVDQGALGDCWNVAGMGAIAHRRPQVFEEIVQEAGEHVIVRLPGRSVAVTRELPMKQGNPLFSGSGPIDPVYWPAYVEKAQAAVSPNGYRSLEGGWAHTTFEQLLDAHPVPEASRGSILRDVAVHDAALEPTTLATRADSSLAAATKARMTELRVYANHTYVVKDHADDTVTLHNPWGVKHPHEPLRSADLEAIFDGLDSPSGYVRYGDRA